MSEGAVTDLGTTDPTTDPIDHEALRARYRLERDKRLRPDGNEQYLQPTGRYAHLLDDPWTERTDRPPLSDEVTVAVIGAGFGGLVTGARLKEAGVTDVRLIDGGGDVGGAWYWNRYPGAMCDTAAMIYLPLLEETGHRPSQKYVPATEIYEHARRIARHYDLYQGALFSTQVTSLDWDEEAGRWIIRTDRGDEIRARYVAMGTGPLHRPKLPGIAGIETFAGHAFHTSRWDYAYTGGGPAGEPMTGLADKRVGIIGTGATAVQCIPHLARSARELYVFQRTPSSVDVRNNHEIDPDWFADLQPGWQREWLLNFATLQTGGFADEDLVRDGWTDISSASRPGRGRVERGEPFPPDGPARLRGERRREDDRDPRSRRRDRLGPGHRRGAQAVVPPAVQAALLPRRVPAGLQRTGHPSRRHRRQGRGAHRRDRGLGRGRALRPGLPDLRLGVRGGHRVRPSLGLRDHRAQR
jgi:thioredoxin reductase